MIQAVGIVALGLRNRAQKSASCRASAENCGATYAKRP